MSYLYLPSSDSFIDSRGNSASGYSTWATSASAITAVPTAAQEGFGWLSNDLVRHDTMNGAMKMTHEWMQFVGQNGFNHLSQNSDFWGNGNDGDLEVDGATAAVTLTRDMYYSNLTILHNGYINTAGFRIYATTLDLSGCSAAGAIRFNGNAGSAGANGTGAGADTAGGAGGASIIGTLCSVSGGTGGDGTMGVATDVPVASASVFSSFVRYPRYSGNGGSAYTGSGDNNTGADGIANFTNEVTVIPICDFAAASYRGQRITGGIGGGGGGGGGGVSAAAVGGSGGGGGASGGHIFIGAQTIIINSAQTGTIQAKGGAGGAGGGGGGSGANGGGGGCGGSGGTVVIVCDAVILSDGTPDEPSAGVADVIDVSGGDGGTGGANATAGGISPEGGDGGNGGVVVIVQLGRTSDDPRRFVYAPATEAGYGADGQNGAYRIGTGGTRAGGAGGVWKVAL